MPLPSSLRINAFTGAGAPQASALHVRGGRWIGGGIELAPKPLRPEPIVNDSEWKDPEVGWGLVLPDNPDLPVAERATAVDAPEPIQELVKQRNAPVLRYSDDLPKLAVRRYYQDGTSDPALVGSKRGIGKGAIPKYLMIYGPPSKVPWRFQYVLSGMSYVGRLDLNGEALENYVNALLDGFAGSGADPHRPLVWAVDHGEPDISALMRRSIAKRVFEAVREDPDLKDGAVYIDGSKEAATHARLVEGLELHPGLVVTTSHGMTGPLNDVAKMAAQMGLLIDARYEVLDVEDLLARWQPDGAIWYAHACCSAGCDARSAYDGLVEEGSFVDQVVKGVAQAGALTSPLPRALLGAKKPLRAFVGQVEPTFDWTLRQKETRQLLTTSTVEALYRHLYQPEPVGFALRECHRHGPVLNTIHLQAKEEYNRTGKRLDEALACRLMAADRESLVILGDPTVILPPL